MRISTVRTLVEFQTKLGTVAHGEERDARLSHARIKGMWFQHPKNVLEPTYVQTA